MRRSIFSCQDIGKTQICTGMGSVSDLRGNQLERRQQMQHSLLSSGQRSRLCLH